MSPLRVPWWVAGGWALDLFGGGQSRLHRDLDIGILRRDAAAVLAALPSWEVFEAKDGLLTPLPGGSLPRQAVNSLWCRLPGSPHWQMELLLDDAGGDRWIFRRQPEISRPLSTLVLRTADGIPYLAPEIQLLYKARRVRAQDQADFDRFAPCLAEPARLWLKTALLQTHPDHRWIDALDS